MNLVFSLHLQQKADKIVSPVFTPKPVSLEPVLIKKQVVAPVVVAKKPKEFNPNSKPIANRKSTFHYSATTQARIGISPKIGAK